MAPPPLSRAARGSVFSGIRRGWLTTVSGRKPADSVLNTEAGEGMLRPPSNPQPFPLPGQRAGGVAANPVAGALVADRAGPGHWAGALPKGRAHVQRSPLSLPTARPTHAAAVEALAVIADLVACEWSLLAAPEPELNGGPGSRTAESSPGSGLLDADALAIAPYGHAGCFPQQRMAAL